MSMEAETELVKRMDTLLVWAQKSNDPMDWQAYWDAVAKAERLLDVRVERTAYERTPEAAA